MGLLKIDEKKCKKDGICVRECPAAIIQHPAPFTETLSLSKI
jgi:ferredoxin